MKNEPVTRSIMESRFYVHQVDEPTTKEMKKVKHIEIKISEPCHENWNEMSVSEQGRFCSSCQKEVVSFSEMNEAQIVTYFQNGPKNVCGQFKTDQLKSYRLPPEPQFITPMRAMVFGSLLSLLSVNNSLAQVADVPVQQDYEEPRIPDCPTPWEGLEEQADSMRSVSGTITMLGSNIPIANVLIIDREHRLSTRSDENGRFNLTIPERFGDKLFYLSVQSEGFYSQERMVLPDQLPVQFNVALIKGANPVEEQMIKGDVQMIMGEVEAPTR